MVLFVAIAIIIATNLFIFKAKRRNNKEYNKSIIDNDFQHDDEDILEKIDVEKFKETKIYKKFCRARKSRITIAFILVLMFEIMSFLGNNPNTNIITLYIIRTILTILLIIISKTLFTIYIKKPQILKGIVVDKRIRTHTHNSRGYRLKTKVATQYLVETPAGKIKGTNIYEYLQKEHTKIEVNDEVICIIYENVDNYLYLIK